MGAWIHGKNKMYRMNTWLFGQLIKGTSYFRNVGEVSPITIRKYYNHQKSMVMNKILNEYETPIPASPQETTLTQRLVSIGREFNFAKSCSADTLVITLIAA